MFTMHAPLVILRWSRTFEHSNCVVALKANEFYILFLGMLTEITGWLRPLITSNQAASTSVQILVATRSVLDPKCTCMG